jgi:hypothetical protein
MGYHGEEKTCSSGTAVILLEISIQCCHLDYNFQTATRNITYSLGLEGSHFSQLFITRMALSKLTQFRFPMGKFCNAKKRVRVTVQNHVP